MGANVPRPTYFCYRDDEGTEHVVEWVTQQDIDLARRITEIAADHKIAADGPSDPLVTASSTSRVVWMV